MAPGDPHPHRVALRAALAAVLLTAPGRSPQPLVESQPAPQRLAVTQRLRATATMMQFSELSELTPANVAGLLPLVGRAPSLVPQDPLLEVPAGAASRSFLAPPADAIELMSQEHPRAHAQPARPAVSYLLGSRVGGAFSGVGASAPRQLRAWDPIDRHVLWSVQETQPISPAALVTAGGLVFYGTEDGWLKALDARTGRLLWSYRVAGRRLDAPISFRGADGHQYIAVHALPPASHAGGETLLFALAH
ncbi:MAG TPA: PQQ-binding-like beta-propeller repeat protein [Steroidobacteraceae bacterium]|nr:PQQ-binding-like beta-propeller repeat protein [Steroidobacteraceae bacterium]